MTGLAKTSLALRVASIERLSPTLCRIAFEAADGGLLPTGMPGAHLSLALPGADRVHRNAYSVTSSPDDRTRYTVIVRRTEVSRGGSQYVHDTLRVSDIVTAAPPSSQFTPSNTARKHLLIGGGIGITPFLSYLPVLRARGQRYELHQFAQRDEVDLFRDLLDADRDHDVHVHAGRQGPAIASILARQPLGTHVYTCGPTVLMEHVHHSAVALGWPARRVHLESFGVAGGTPFVIELARSGGIVTVGEHQTMLEALEDAGLPMRSLCRGGACGECVTRVIAGVPDHRDHFLTDAEKTAGDRVMACVSRALTPRIALDL